MVAKVMAHVSRVSTATEPEIRVTGGTDAAARETAAVREMWQPIPSCQRAGTGHAKPCDSLAIARHEPDKEVGGVDVGDA